MNATEIAIVDRGRGMQLSTSRITVQDLVPYIQQGCSHDEIIRWIPSLTHEEITVVERYYREHLTEMDEQDRRIKERSEERLARAQAEQRQKFPWIYENDHLPIEERRAILWQRLEESKKKQSTERQVRP